MKAMELKAKEENRGGRKNKKKIVCKNWICNDVDR